jgi:hypothetical protein
LIYLGRSIYACRLASDVPQPTPPLRVPQVSLEGQKYNITLEGLVCVYSLDVVRYEFR